MPDLMIELFSEEIPARMQPKAAADLKALITDGLVEAGLTYASAAAFSTPRRLTLSVEGLLDRSPDTREDRKGPKVGAPDKAIEGFLRGAGVAREDLQVRDTGKGEVYFAVIEKQGRPAPQIVAETLDHVIRHFPWPKSMRWGAGSLRWVRPLHAILCILTTEEGAEIVPLDVDGITSGAVTRGHRFMAPDPISVTSFEDYEAKLKRAHVILRPEDRAGHIWNDATNRAFAQGLEMVEDKGLLAEVAGLVEWPVVLMGEIDETFLDLPPEVLMTSMKEHQKFFSVRDPRSGRITRFVTVANIETADDGATILAGNQKVLAARLSDAKFFWENDLRKVASIGLEGMGAGLADVTFHNKLGSQADRVERIAALAREIAPLVGARPDLAAEAATVCKADLQSEMVGEFPELQGLMGRHYAVAAGHDDGVPEACEEHYKPLGPGDAVPTAPVSVAVALADKIDTLTGFWAIDEKPTGSKDPFALRRAALGVIRLVLENRIRMSIIKSVSESYFAFVVELGKHDFHYYSRKITTASPEDGEELVTAWRQLPLRDILLANEINEEEAGLIEVKLLGLEMDVFDEDAKKHQQATNALKKLRSRAELADHLCAAFIFPLIDEDGNDLNESANFRQLFQLESYSSIWKYGAEKISSDLLYFLHDRLKVHLRDEGVRHDVIDACLSMPGNDDLTLLVHRARALGDFLKTDDGENLLQGFKRANNILTQAEEKDGVEYSFGADPKFAETDAETALFAALDAAETRIGPAMEAEDFAEAMSAMADLRAPIDAFFEAVQINTDNDILRRNRLNLLSRIRTLCLSVADLARIDG